MRYFRHEVGGPEVHLYPLVCWHVGAKQSSERFINEVITQIKKDPLARWIYMGDAGECVTKLSKGDIYEQLMSPGEQLRTAAQLLAPIKDKGLFGIRGNHGNRIDRETGLGWDETLCARIGIPYLGVSAMGEIILSRYKSSRSVSLYVHHGSASAITPAGKMSAAHKPEAFINADICLTAHTHACGEAWPQTMRAEISTGKREIVWKRTHTFVCGSAYDSRSGYAEEKMYPPLVPEHLVITAVMSKSGEWKLAIDFRKIRAAAEEFTQQAELSKWRTARQSMRSAQR